MPQASDSSFIAVSRHLQAPRRFAAFVENDDLLVRDPPVVVDEDTDTVAPAGSAAAVAAAERRRKEEGWSDLGLSEIMGPQSSTAARDTDGGTAASTGQN